MPHFRFGPEPVHLSGWGWLLGIEQIVEHTKWHGYNNGRFTHKEGVWGEY